MNKYLAVLCTPSIYHPNALRSINSLKLTNLKDVELVIADNCNDLDFRHAKVMQEYLYYASGGPVIFLDDDIVINDPDWIEKLVKCAEKTGAAIVGCIHTYPSGEVNHEGILVYHDGSTELLRERIEKSPNNYYVPAVSSAAMLVTETNALSFDTAFAKYQHDVDLCLSAWTKGFKVARTSELKIVHQLGGFASGVDGFRDLYLSDSSYLQKKWKNFVSRKLYQKPEIASFSELAEEFNWERFYNEASFLSASDPKKAVWMFSKIVKDCPFRWRRSGAYFHLYKLEGDHKNLQHCVQLNGLHQAAVNELMRLETIEESFC